MKVVLLSASTGNGHMSAARAIEAELKAHGHDAKTVDVLDHTGKGFRGWYRGGYEVLVKKKPKLWGHLYRSSDKKRFNYWFQTGLDYSFVARMRRFIVAEDPDWVLCTHSLPQPILSRWRRKLRFKIGVVVTDLYPQLMWLRGDPDWFFVPGDWSKTILLTRHPRAKSRTTVTGIPVDRQFANEVDKKSARTSLGLDPELPTVLVTSGGIGGGPVGDVVRSLAALGGAQVVVVCGRSEQAFLAASEAARSAQGTAKFVVKGHVQTPEMAALMHAADLMVAKPGGITTFEALAAGLPFVVFDPFLIPGQEEKNAEFLVENGIGRRASDPSGLVAVVTDLLASPEKRAECAVNALKHAKPDAAETIVSTLEGSARRRT